MRKRYPTPKPQESVMVLTANTSSNGVDLLDKMALQAKFKS